MLHAIVKTGLALALACLPLTACVDAGGSYPPRLAWTSQPYDGWYDGYYGPVYDGYWGTDNSFYYRRNANDRYRRGDRNHFQRGKTAPSQRHRRLEGRSLEPAPGSRMPHYPGRNNADRSKAREKKSKDKRAYGGHDKDD
jgi:hypothetical protein